MPNELPSRPRTVKVTLDVPAERQEAFMRLWREFASGETPQDEVIRQRARDREQGIASLQALVKVAQGRSGQCRYIARFLAGLYNGPRFPFDLTDLRPIDDALLEHALAVLRMDHRPEKEVHRYFVEGSKLWEEEIIHAWDLDKEAALHSAYLLAGFLGRTEDPDLQQLARRIDAWREKEQRDQ